MYAILADVESLLYTRQSRAANDDELAVLRQQEDGHKLASLRGWSVADTFCDNDFSAAGKRHRPDFERLLAAIETGRYKAVIAWALDRLTRNARDRLRLVEACARHSVTIALVRGADIDPSTPGGRLVAGILGEVAEHEIAQKADRQRRAAQQAAENGLPYGGKRCFGYEPDKMTLRMPEAEALKQAYQDVLDGIPLGAIARRLNRSGFTTALKTRHRHGCSPPCGRTLASDCPNRTGNGPSSWTAQSLRNVLLTPRYAGLRARTVRPARGRPTWEVVAPAKWPAVVSTEVFDAVRVVLTDPTRRKVPRSDQAMLTGLAVCGIEECGATVHGGRSAKTGKKTYRCSKSLGHFCREQAPVDVYVGKLVCERLSRPDALELMVPPKANTAAERTELAAMRTRLRTAPKLWMEGVISEAELRDIRAALPPRIAALETKLADRQRVELLRPLITAEDIERVWFEGYGDDRRRAVIDILTSKVRILPPGRGKRTFEPNTVLVTPRESL